MSRIASATSSGVSQLDPGLDQRQLALVDHPHAALGSFHGSQHVAIHSVQRRVLLCEIPDKVDEAVMSSRDRPSSRELVRQGALPDPGPGPGAPRALRDDLGHPGRAALHRGRPRGLRSRRASWATRESTRSRAACSRRCTAAASGPCASTPASAPPRRRTGAIRYLLEQGQTGLSVAFDLPTQMGYDSDHAMATGEVGKVGVAISSLDGHGGAVRRHPARPGLHLDDDQLDGGDPARASTSRWPGKQGADLRPAAGHDPERPAQGVHRPRHLHLPARGVAAHHQRHLRLLPRASCRAGTRSRSPATTCARPARRRCRRSPSRWPTRSPTARRRWRAA